MFRSSMRALALATCLAVLGVQSATTHGSANETVAVATAEDVEGRGWKAILACAACLGAGIALVGAGFPAIVAAASAPGSTIALAGCIAACASM